MIFQIVGLGEKYMVVNGPPSEGSFLVPRNATGFKKKDRIK